MRCKPHAVGKATDARLGGCCAAGVAEEKMAHVRAFALAIDRWLARVFKQGH